MKQNRLKIPLLEQIRIQLNQENLEKLEKSIFSIEFLNRMGTFAHFETPHAKNETHALKH